MKVARTIMTTNAFVWHVGLMVVRLVTMQNADMPMNIQR